MYVGLARFDLLVPHSRSLKDKRSAVKHLLSAMKSRYNVACAEVGFLDLRQRSAIGVTSVSNSSFHVRKMLQEVERFVRSDPAIEFLDAVHEVVTPDAAQLS